MTRGFEREDAINLREKFHFYWEHEDYQHLKFIDVIISKRGVLIEGRKKCNRCFDINKAWKYTTNKRIIYLCYRCKELKNKNYARVSPSHFESDRRKH